MRSTPVVTTEKDQRLARTLCDIADRSNREAGTEAEFARTVDSVRGAGRTWPVIQVLLQHIGRSADRLRRFGGDPHRLLATATSATTADLLLRAVSGGKDAARVLEALFEKTTQAGREAEAMLSLLPGAAVTMSAQAEDAALRSVAAPAPVVWPEARPVNPKALAELRARLLVHLDSRAGLALTTAALEDGNGTLVPLTSPADAARILHAQERARLARARLFSVDDEMTAAAIRRARRGRRDRLSPTRVPARRGFLAFGTLLTYTAGPGRPSPAIVAVSWGPWNHDFADAPPDIAPLKSPDAPAQPYWAINSAATGTQTPTVPGQTGPTWWITLWVRVDGIPLGWENEAILAQDAFLHEAGPHTLEEVVHTVVACWDYMTQHQVSTTTLTREQTRQRRPADQRADRRKDVTDDGTVTVVTLRGRRPAVPGQRSQATTHGVEGGLDYRMEIDEYDRSQCMNPHRHADLGGAPSPANPDGQCHHEPITVPGYIRGTDGAPLRVAKTKVHQLTGRSGIDKDSIR